MTLNEIRKVEQLEQLLPAIKFLCDNMHEMTWGEFNGYKRTIENQATKINVSLRDINNIAENYQLFNKLEI